MKIYRWGPPSVVLLAVVLFGQSCGSDDGREEGENSDGRAPVLLTSDGDSGESFSAEVTGTLGLNERDCFTVGDAILITDSSVRISRDGPGLGFPNGVFIELGDTLVGEGGYISQELAEAQPKPEYDKCLPDGDEPYEFAAVANVLDD